MGIGSVVVRKKLFLLEMIKDECKCCRDTSTLYNSVCGVNTEFIQTRACGPGLHKFHIDLDLIVCLISTTIDDLEHRQVVAQSQRLCES